MNGSYQSANYSFSLGKMNFTVEIDDTLSAEFRSTHYPETNKKHLHFHPMHEIFFVFGEDVHISFENGIENFKNSIVCLPPNTKHFTHRSSDYRLLISPGKLSARNDGCASFFNDFLNAESVSVVPLASENLKALLCELSDIFYNHKNEMSAEIVTSILKLIMYRIYSDNAESERDNEYVNESQYLAISKLVNECTTPGNTVTIENIAEVLHLSKRQVTRIVQKYYGKPLSVILTEEKLNYAAYLLTSTNIPISDIALQSNFHSDNYFFKRFKAHFGTTPLQYRKSAMRK